LAILQTPTAIAGVGFHRRLFVCLSVCLFIRTICQTPMQLGSSNLTHNGFAISPKHIHFRSKGQGHKSEKIVCRRGSLHSCECWLLLVIRAITESRVFTDLHTILRHIF